MTRLQSKLFIFISTSKKLNFKVILASKYFMLTTNKNSAHVVHNYYKYFSCSNHIGFYDESPDHLNIVLITV